MKTKANVKLLAEDRVPQCLSRASLQNSSFSQTSEVPGKFSCSSSINCTSLMSSGRAMSSLQKLCWRSHTQRITTAVQRSLSTYSAPTRISHHPSVPIRKPALQSTLRPSFQRSYAEVVTPKTKRRGRGILRWTWRLTYLSAIGSIIYLGYTIYDDQIPTEQVAPDPTKKTLVILGLANNSIIN